MRTPKAIQHMKCSEGLTLIELLIVVIIVGILAAIAIPSYTGYTMRARRADAKTILEQLRAAQEMRRAERGSYATSIQALRNTWGLSVEAAGSNFVFGDYTITMVATSTTFTATAAPRTDRQRDDGPLTINHLGVKTPADKWAK